MSQMNDSLLREIKLSQQSGKPTYQLLQLLIELAKIVYNNRYPAGVKNADLEQTMINDTIAQLTKSYVSFNPELTDNAYAYLHSCAIGPMIRAILKHKRQNRKINDNKRGIWG